MSNEFNPYSAPTAAVEDVTPGVDAYAEATRREHIDHEASIQSIGLLYYFGGFSLAVAALVSLFGALDGLVRLGMLALLAVLAVLMFAMGRGLRALKPGIRIPAIVFAAIGLLGFPVGTLINAYVLYLLLSKKGRMILSPEYADIVAATPHIKYQTSWVVRIFLGLIIVGVLAAILIPLFSR